MDTTTWVVFTGVCVMSVVVSLSNAKAPSLPPTPKPPPMSSMEVFKECCPQFPTIVQESSVRQCMKEEEKSKKSPLNQISGKCVSECAFKKDGFMTDYVYAYKRSVNFTALDVQLKKSTDADWDTIIAEARTACKSKGSLKKTTKCYNGANSVMKCLTAHFIVKCPTPNATEACMRRLVRMNKVITRNGLSINQSTTQVLLSKASPSASNNATSNATSENANNTITVAQDNGGNNSPPATAVVTPAVAVAETTTVPTTGETNTTVPTTVPTSAETTITVATTSAETTTVATTTAVNTTVAATTTTEDSDNKRGSNG